MKFFGVMTRCIFRIFTFTIGSPAGPASAIVAKSYEGELAQQNADYVWTLRDFLHDSIMHQTPETS